MRKDEDVEILKSAGVYTAPGSAPNHYVEHLSVADLSVGTYSIPAGGLDDQTPHTEDEIYVVTAGRARIVTAGGSAEIGPGSVIYVPAAEEHHSSTSPRISPCSSSSPRRSSPALPACELHATIRHWRRCRSAPE